MAELDTDRSERADRRFPGPEQAGERFDAVVRRGRQLRLARRARIAGATAAAVSVLAVAGVALAGGPTTDVVADGSGERETTSTTRAPTTASTTTTVAPTTVAPTSVAPPVTTAAPALVAEATTTTGATAQMLRPLGTLTVRIEGSDVILEDPAAPVTGPDQRLCVTVQLTGISTTTTATATSLPAIGTTVTIHRTCVGYDDPGPHALNDPIRQSDPLADTAELRTGPIWGYQPVRATFRLGGSGGTPSGSYEAVVKAESGLHNHVLNPEAPQVEWIDGRNFAQTTATIVVP